MVPMKFATVVPATAADTQVGEFEFTPLLPEVKIRSKTSPGRRQAKRQHR